MKKPIIIIALLLLSTVFIKAQEVKKSVPQPDSVIKVIPVGEGRNNSYLYTIGGKLQTREDVVIKLLAYTPSAFEINRAKNSTRWSYISAGGFLVSSIAATVDFATKNKNVGAAAGFTNGQPAIVYQHHNLNGAYILTGVATAFLISSIINLSKAAVHSGKAIKLYNQQYQ